MEVLAVVGPKTAERRLAKPHRLFEHRVEHRREVAGRGIDDLQNLGGRGLLLQRLVALRSESFARSALGKLTLEIGDESVADRLRCGQASDSFADLVGTEFPDGSYRDRRGPPCCSR